METIDFQQMEKKWQDRWKAAKIFEPKVDKKKKKFFFTTPYPYISGSLHIGHGRAVIESDVYCRFLRMKGFNVLYPLAFHITGTPVLGISAAIASGDEKRISLYRHYVSNYVADKKMQEKIVESFKEPWNVVNFFIPRMMDEYGSLGLSIDWTRRFTTGDRDYQKLITWQFHKYKEKNYLIKGSYPVLYCPRDENAVGEDDIQDADTNPVEKQEFTLLKFHLKSRDAFLVAATLRPETVFGQTNLWVNPEAEYVKIRAGKENWIVSKPCHEKLSFQKKGLQTLEYIEGIEMVGEHADAPVINRKLIILPSAFADPNIGSGIVTSVPSDAPYDWMALKDLQESREECGKYNLDYNEIKNIQVIPIIFVPGFGEAAAVKISNEMKLKNQHDPRLKEATQIIYKMGFHRGVLNKNCGEYAGLNVAEVKERIKKRMLKNGHADLFYETSREAFCRCGEKICVSVLEDQWFLDFNAKGWKEKAFKCLESLELTPETIRKQFQEIFEWLDKRPAARKRGLGTPLPFDRDWIIESLSDSTIYMVFYVIKNLIVSYKIRPDQMTLDFFDYIFLGKGEILKISRETGIRKEILKELRENLDYWYPVDHRHTFMAHLSNHLSFYIFAHAGIFPQNFWPRKISMHGFVISDGVKMSKSKGNVITLLEVKKRFGADVFRSYIITTTTLEGTFDWKDMEAENMKRKLFSIYSLLLSMSEKRRAGQINLGAKAFLAKFEKSVKESDQALSEMRLRDYGNIVLNLIPANLKKLQRRVQEKELFAVYYRVLDKWLKMLAPIVPHIAEDMWEKLGNKSFISLESWPEVDSILIDEKMLATDELIDQTIHDINHILKLVKKPPSKAHIYVSPIWKYTVYKILIKGPKGKKNLVSEIMKNPEVRKQGKEAVHFAESLVKASVELSAIPDQKAELEALEQAREFISKETGIKEIKVWREEDTKKHDPVGKSRQAKPLRPAIFLE